MSQDTEEDKLSQTIIQLIKEKNPENVKQLIALVKEKTGVTEKKIFDQVLQLETEEKITFRKPSKLEVQKLSAYLQTENAYWYWATIIIAMSTATVAFTVPEDAYPIAYIRYLLGAVFVFWFPGYSFIKALFPAGQPLKTFTRSLDLIERVALSIGMSLALVPMVSLLFNYTTWGIRLTPIVLSLLALTIVFATVAIVREYQNRIKVAIRES